jgi:hypothetical protein
VRGLNAAAHYFLLWAMLASTGRLHASMVALVRELTSAGRSLLPIMDMMTDTRTILPRNSAQRGCARRLGYTYPIWGGVADRSRMGPWAVDEKLSATRVPVTRLERRGGSAAVTGLIDLSLSACMPPAPTSPIAMPMTLQLEGGHLRLGKGMPRCLRMGRGTVALLEFADAALRLGGRVEGRRYLPAGMTDARNMVVTTVWRAARLRGTGTLGGVTVPCSGTSTTSLRLPRGGNVSMVRGRDPRRRSESLLFAAVLPAVRVEEALGRWRRRRGGSTAPSEGVQACSRLAMLWAAE